MKTLTFLALLALPLPAYAGGLVDTPGPDTDRSMFDEATRPSSLDRDRYGDNDRLWRLPGVFDEVRIIRITRDPEVKPTPEPVPDVSPVPIPATGGLLLLGVGGLAALRRRR